MKEYLSWNIILCVKCPERNLVCRVSRNTYQWSEKTLYSQIRLKIRVWIYNSFFNPRFYSYQNITEPYSDFAKEIFLGKMLYFLWNKNAQLDTYFRAIKLPIYTVFLLIIFISYHWSWQKSVFQATLPTRFCCENLIPRPRKRLRDLTHNFNP